MTREPQIFSASDPEAIALIEELQQANIKHSPEKILKIARLTDGKIVFLETGNTASGLEHIINNHRRDFAERGISEDNIADAVMIAVTLGKIVGYQSPNRPIYEICFQDKMQLIAVTTSNNGYLVCANPASL